MNIFVREQQLEEVDVLDICNKCFQVNKIIQMILEGEKNVGYYEKYVKELEEKKIPAVNCSNSNVWGKDVGIGELERRQLNVFETKDLRM